MQEKTTTGAVIKTLMTREARDPAVREEVVGEIPAVELVETREVESVVG